MKMRFAFLIVVFVVPAFAADGAIRPGEKFEGELKVKEGYPWLGFVDTYTDWATEVPVALKAGQNVTFAATVIGKNRRVSVALLDPTGKMIAATKRDTAIKSVTLKVEEVPATGEYRIVVLSNLAGGFELTTSDPANRAASTRAALEQRIKQLKKELADAESALQALPPESIKRP